MLKMGPSSWNFVPVLSLSQYISGGSFTPSPVDGNGRKMGGSMPVKGELTPDFNLFTTHYAILVHYVCTDFITESFCL